MKLTMNESNLSMNDLKNILKWMHCCGVLLHFNIKRGGDDGDVVIGESVVEQSGNEMD